LATFNGAFRGVNGQFGALAQGITALPARDDFATLVIYADGALRIGEWGRDFEFEPEMDALRQNCRLIIDAGRISERVYNDSVFDWGAAVSGEIVTLRSAIGLDAARQVLYYFAGTSLSMPVLARAMEAVGVEYGMLLDINHYWVLFNAHRPSEEGLTSEPLYPEVMKEAVDRYLGTSARDFFYLTSIDEPVP
jgi:hypothetical protein